jgi:hypothetical protein
MKVSGQRNDLAALIPGLPVDIDYEAGWAHRRSERY